MEEYKSLKELYVSLIPAFNVKLRMLKSKGITFISREDIWNYLKTTKWEKSINLGIAEMVSDIINTSDLELDNYSRKNKSIEGVLF
jgi:hypothetical protein